MMRVTYHNARTHADGRAFSPRHNDRDFTIEHAANIDEERTIDNVYYNLYDGWYTESERESMPHTFYEAEREYYEATFGRAYLEQQRRHEAARNYGRMKTFDEWMYGVRNNLPVETFLQIGKSGDGNHATPDVMMACGDELIARLDEWSAEHDDCVRILDVAYHFDEEVPQFHMRRVFQYEDDDGVMRIGQSEALERAGVKYDVEAAVNEHIRTTLAKKRKQVVKDETERAKSEGCELSRDDVKRIRASVTLTDDEERAIRANPRPSRHANRLMTFDSMVRGWWMDICESHGVEVERTPLPPHRSKEKEQMLWERELEVRDEEQRVDAARRDLEAMRRNVALEVEEANARLMELGERQDESERELNLVEQEIGEARRDVGNGVLYDFANYLSRRVPGLPRGDTLKGYVEDFSEWWHGRDDRRVLRQRERVERAERSRQNTTPHRPTPRSHGASRGRSAGPSL